MRILNLWVLIGIIGSIIVLKIFFDLVLELPCKSNKSID